MLADLVGAIRLPGGAHQRAAGTTRRHRPDHPAPPRAGPGRGSHRLGASHARQLDGIQVPVNEYFLANPAAVLGTLGAAGGAYNAADLTVTPPADTLQAFTTGLDAHRRPRAPPRPHPVSRTSRAGKRSRASFGTPRRLSPGQHRRHVHRSRRRRRPSVRRAPQPGRRTTRRCSACATRRSGCWKPSRPPPTTPRTSAACEPNSAAGTTPTCAATGR